MMDGRSVQVTVTALVLLWTNSLVGGLALRAKEARTLQMIGSVSPQMLHQISDDLKPDTSKVVHIQVPYYVDHSQMRPKKYKPWVPRTQRYLAGPFKQSKQQYKFNMLQDNYKRQKEFMQANSLPGPYDTPFAPIMKPSPVNPLHVEPPPEIMFEPISILPLEAPVFTTLRNHVNLLKDKQQAFFETEGQEFGLIGQHPVTGDDGHYLDDPRHLFGTIHNGDEQLTEQERNTLSENDFGQNDRKYDRRGKIPAPSVTTIDSGEEDFYDSEGKEYADDDFEDSKEDTEKFASFEPKKMYTQVRHEETTRHVPSRGHDERHQDDDDGDDAEEDEDDEDDGEGEVEDDDDEDGATKRYSNRGPVKEKVLLKKKNIVYSEKGREAQQFDHGSEEAHGEFEEESQPTKRRRIKRSAVAVNESAPALLDEERRKTLAEVMALMALASGTNLTALPHAEALVDPRQLHGDELIKFLDEAISNTSQYLPEGRQHDVINIVNPPSNVVKFPYYHRPASEIDLDSALRYAENLTTFASGLYDRKSGSLCNEVDVDIEDEPEAVDSSGFKPIKRLQGLGDKINCLKNKHFGKNPLDNPLFGEEFVTVPRRATNFGPRQPQPQPQSNPAVAVYNDVIRHIKRHMAAQKVSKSDEPDTLMIAVPRKLVLDNDYDDESDDQPTAGSQKREAKLAFPQFYNPSPVSNHISVPIFDISKYYPRFMVRPNIDLYDSDNRDVKNKSTMPKISLETLEHEAEKVVEGVTDVGAPIEETAEIKFGTKTRDDIADAFDDVAAKPTTVAPLQPIKPYDVIEKITDSRPEATFNKSGPPYAALAMEPPVAQSIIHQRLAQPAKRNPPMDYSKAKRAAKMGSTFPKRRYVARKKVIVLVH